MSTATSTRVMDKETESIEAPVPCERPRSHVGLNSLFVYLGMQIGMQLLRLFLSVFFARLLMPEALGLMALLNVFLQGLQMLSDVGVWICVVRSPRGDDPAFLRTAWTVQVIRGFLLWIAACVLAWPASIVFHQPLLLYMLPVAGANSAIAGFYSVSIFAMNRRMLFGRIQCIELLSYIIPTTLALLWIWHDPTVWALVGSALGSALLQLILSHWWLPKFKHRFCWQPQAVRELYGFGRWIFIGTFLTFLTNQADRLLVGHWATAADLGCYHIAAMFAGLPAYFLSCLSNKWLIPYFSRLREGDPVHARQQSQRVYGLAVFFAWMMTSGLMLIGPELLGFLYPGPYREAISLLPLLLLANWFQILQSIRNADLLADGKASLSAFLNSAKVIVLGIFVPFAVYSGNWENLIWVWLAGDFCRYLLTWRRTSHLGTSASLVDLLFTFVLLGMHGLTNVTSIEFAAKDVLLIRLGSKASLFALVCGLIAAGIFLRFRTRRADPMRGTHV